MDEQRSPEWFAARLGNLTGSRFAAALDIQKSGKPGSKRELLIRQLVAERLTGEPTEFFETRAMRYGTEHEDEARAAYIMETGNDVDPAPYTPHPTIAKLGASPDGLIGDFGVLEIKVPESSTFVKYCISGEVPDEYKPQMLLELLCTGRAWCDFVAYDPRVIDPDLRLFIKRFEPSFDEIKEAEKQAVEFLAIAADVESKIRNRKENK